MQGSMQVSLISRCKFSYTYCHLLPSWGLGGGGGELAIEVFIGTLLGVGNHRVKGYCPEPIVW